MNPFSFFPLSLNELSCQIRVSSVVIFIADGGIHRVNVEQMSCDSFLCILCVGRNKSTDSSHVIAVI